MMRKRSTKGLLGIITAMCIILFALTASCQVFAAEGVAEEETDFEVALSPDKKEIYITGLTGTDITKVVIPSVIDNKPVTKINSNAFRDKTSITEVVIPDSVKIIGEYAFYNCNGMTDITIPIDANYATNTFYYCSSINVINFTRGQSGEMLDADDNGYTSGNGFWYTNTIANQAGNLEKVTFCDGITHIGANCIRERGKLTTIEFPNNEFSVGYAAFYGNSAAEIDGAVISNVTSMGAHAFQNCAGLKNISFNEKLKEIPIYAFYNCQGIEKITIEETIEKIDSEAFRYCGALKEVTIPVDLKYSTSAFYNCADINVINFTPGKTGEMFDTDDNGYSSGNDFWYTNTIACQAGNLETVNFSDGITHIGANSIRERSKLTSIKFPNNKFSVGYAAFYEDSAAVINDSDISNVTSMGAHAFQHCLGLKNISFNDELKEIPAYAFYNCQGLEELTIPDTVETIGGEAFRYCGNMTKVSIPVDAKYATSSFYDCPSINTINFTPGKSGEMFDVDDGGFNSGNSFWYTNTIAYQAVNLETVNFSDGVKYIGANTLRNRDKLVNVKFPTNEFSVGYAAFYQDTLLSISDEDILKVTAMGAHAFQQCAGLTNCKFNSKLQQIPYNAFWGCAGIETLTIHDNITDIGSSAFEGCYNITEISIPIDVNYTNNSFSENDNVRKVIYTKGKTKVSANSDGHDAYYSLQRKTDYNETVIFEEGVESIDINMFNDNCNKSIKNVKFPKTIENVAKGSFVSGIDATFYGYVGTNAEEYVKNANDDTIVWRPLLYPQITEGPTDTELGNDYQYSAFVYTDIDTEETVTEWSVKDSNSKKTVIDETGKLTVGDNEKSRDIKVCASYDEYTVEIPVKVNRTKFIVEFNAGKGEASEDALATTDDKKLSSLPTAAYDYYTFDGWFTAEEDGDEVTTETVFEDDAIVYAHYSKTPVESIDIKAGAQPKSGVAFDTAVKSVSDNVDADSVTVSYMSGDKAVEGNAKCEVAYTAKVTFKLKNGYTNSDKTVLKINDSEVQLKKLDGGKYEGVVTFKATTHGEAVLKGAKEATKTEEGYTGDKCCSICNEILERGKVIPKLADEKKTEEKTTEKKPAETPAGDGVGTISADGKILTDTTGKKYYVAAKVTAAQLKANLMVADKKSGGKYKITKLTKNMKTKKVTGGTVTYMAPYNRNCTKATMPEFVKIAGVKFKVTALNKDAFKNCKKIKTVTIGKNITKIGANAFSGCAKLQSVSIKAAGLKSIGSNAFKGISSKAKFKVPKKQYTKYSKMIKKAKAPKTAKISK